MSGVLSFIRGFMDLGATVLLPFVILLLGMFFRMKPGQALKAGLMTGIGFQGLVLAVNLMISSMQPVMEFYKGLGSGFDVLEIGFASLGAASWTVPFAVFVVPAIILINLLFVRLKITKVLNVDIWNFMHFLVPGALAYALSGSAVIGFLVALACGILVLFFAEKLAPQWGEFFGLEGTTCTTLAFSAWVYPITRLINKGIDFIPGLNKLDADFDKIGEKLGILGDPAIIGLLVGAVLSLLTKQSLGNGLKVSMGLAAAMVLIPRMVSIMMEGLTPLGQAANSYMHSRLGKDAEIYIGMDIALGLGDPACITATAIMIPVTVFLAFLIPGMRFFPLGILGEVCYLAPMCVLTSKGNIVRSLISMTIMMTITLFFANLFAPQATQMLAVTGVQIDGVVTASHFGWNPGNLIVCFVNMLFR
ncbi:MAG: PTS transporter subunit IIC [Peptoniphilaceae bacterium]|nr:PTS galactitol transporter subunit IIC [Peptoniphilaceae bacterium]MDD7434487.1 PTS galactitol transporter subunit IIC [Peptoniphilaceae bacterium]MDY3076474.1 PTS transporter subunit IIC [Peptoniphilaceae bacterium]